MKLSQTPQDDNPKDDRVRKDSGKCSPTASPFTMNQINTRTMNALFAPSTTAKIWAVASKHLDKTDPPRSMPEYTLPNETSYVYTEACFWTSGFFPGSLYLLRERQRKWPERSAPELHHLHLEHACRWWSYHLHEQASQRGTHDLGFLIQPWAQLGWELDGDQKCRASLVEAAYVLADRFDARVGCIRSWDACVTKKYSFLDPVEDFLVIIDNMMNLDLLYLVAELEHDQSLADMATSHALTTMGSHIRPDHSTCHVVNFDQQIGTIKQRMTNQGYSDESCWSRGQAWGIAGYAQCFHRTRNDRFLQVAIGLADYFLARLSSSGVPYWDFDAPAGPWDTSAAMIATYGMLMIYQTDTKRYQRFCDAALRMLDAVIATSLSPEAEFRTSGEGSLRADTGGHDTILLHATINNFEFAPRRWADHGLVYADYYFLLVGNKLLELGLV